MKFFPSLPALKKINRNSLFVKYIAFLLAMLVIPMLLGVTVLSISMNAMLQQAKEDSYKELRQVQKEFDSDMEKIRTTAVGLAMDEELLAYQYDKNDPQSVYDLFAVMQKAGGTVQNEEGLVLDVYVYLKENDLYISSGGRFFGQELYDSCFQYGDVAYNEWNRLMDGRYFDAVVPQEEVRFRDAKGTRPAIAYLQSFPVNQTGGIKGNIIVLLDAGKLAEKFSGYGLQESSFTVVDRQNQVVLHTGNPDYQKTELLTLEDGYSEQRVGREKVLVSVCQGTNAYRYISVESSKQIYAQAKPAKYVLIWYVVGILLLGLGVLAVVIYKGILPVKKMLSNLGVDFGVPELEAAGGNELDYLAAGFRKLMNEKQNIEDIVRQQKPTMRRNLLSDLINDDRGDGNFDGACKAAGLDFLYESCLVVIFQLSAQRREEEFQNAALIKYAISNIAEELFSKHAQAFVIDTGWRECAVLVNFDPGHIDDKAVMAHCSLLKRVIDEQLEEHVQVSVGGTYRDVQKVSFSYEEAKRAAAYQTLVGDGGVVLYGDIKNSGQKYHYHYSLEQENALINAVTLGDSARARERLEQIIDLNQNLSFDVTQLLFFDLMCTALRVLNQQDYDLGVLFEGEEPYRRIMDCKSFRELKEAIAAVLEKICGYVSQNRSDKKEAVKTDMLRFIEDRLADPNLSMEMVADAFSLNYTYVSHFFKDYIGENFSSYLAKLKTEKAKGYLRDSRFTVGEIATKLGYANSTVLIRNFKKITGMTPGQYRDMQTER